MLIGLNNALSCANYLHDIVQQSVASCKAAGAKKTLTTSHDPRGCNQIGINLTELCLQQDHIGENLVEKLVTEQLLASN